MSAILVAAEKVSAPDDAVACGVALGAELCLPVVILHVVTDASNEADLQGIEDAVATWSDLGAYPVTHRFKAGKEDDAIVREARDVSAKVIVLGAHRHSLLSDLFGHSTVEGVVEDTDRIVLVAGSGRHEFRRILVAVDFSEPSNSALRAAASLFPEAELHVIHAYHVPFEGFLRSTETHDAVRAQAEQEFRAFISAAAANPGFNERLGRSILREGETITVIGEALEDLAADLLVIGTSGQGGMFSAPFGSTAREYLENPPCDVLAVQCRSVT